MLEKYLKGILLKCKHGKLEFLLLFSKSNCLEFTWHSEIFSHITKLSAGGKVLKEKIETHVIYRSILYFSNISTHSVMYFRTSMYR
jgi:hypothetical protein